METTTVYTLVNGCITHQ